MIRTVANYFLGRAGYSRTNRRPVINQQRKFAAAEAGRLFQSWQSSGGSIDAELLTQLPTLRSRSRDICMNNSYGIQFLRKLKQNVIGATGIRYQARARRADGTLDSDDNKRLEEAYLISGEIGNYDVTGKMSRSDGERLFIETTARDGESLVRMVPNYPNEVGFAVEHLDPDRLDWSKNIAKLSNGNRVVMGVELNGFNKPVAYYISTSKDITPLSGQAFAGTVRVPAEDMIHAYIPLRVEGTRGVPWMHAAMVELHHLGGYREAGVVAARVGANKLGWFRGETANPVTGDGEDEQGNVIIDAEPGTFGQLSSEADLVTWDPQYPHEQFGEFNKALLQGVSSGIGVSYPTFANDLQGVNFSSMRGGTQDERDGYMCIQNWAVSSHVKPIQQGWLGYQLVAKRIPIIANLPMSGFKKFRKVAFQPRRWQWVDPLKDVTANNMSIKNRTRSRSSVIRDLGDDPEEVWDEIQREELEIAKRGISLEDVDAKIAQKSNALGQPGDNEDE